jgi:hypothetical protein
MKDKPTDISPSKVLAQKRVVSFTKSMEDDYDDISPPETPTKKRKLDQSSTKTNSPSSASEAQGLSAFEAAMFGRNGPDKEASVHVADIDLPMTPSSPGPSTRRRTLRSVRQNQTKTMERDTAMEVDKSSVNDHTPSPPPQPRRLRPIFLDRKQWSSRNPRIAREWPAMMEHKRSMVDLYGHPLAAQMPDFQMQDV